MAHLRFDGVYKKANRVLIEELHLFPEVKYNKILERLSRYENLLAECLELFELDNFQIVDSKPIQTKKLARFARHQKAGNSHLIKEQEDIGYNRLKGGHYVGYKITCSTDGRFLKLLYISPASKHDISIIKERYKDFIDRFRGHIVLLDKGYRDENFTKFMRAQGVGYIAIKRRNMIRDEKEKRLYRFLRRIRRIIETRFSQLEEFGLRFIRAVSRRGLAIKIVLSILAFNIYQLMGGKI